MKWVHVSDISCLVVHRIIIIQSLVVFSGKRPNVVGGFGEAESPSSGQCAVWEHVDADWRNRKGVEIIF